MTIKIHALNTVSMDIVGLEQIYLWGGSMSHELREGPMRPHAYCSHISMPDGFTREGMKNPAPMFYIEGAGKKILVETGVSPANADTFNDCVLKYGISQWYNKGPEHDIEELLKSRGVRPEEIDIVIPTHLHLDHGANAEQFPNAKILLQRDSLPWAIMPPKWAPYFFEEFRPFFTKVVDRMVMIEGDVEVVPGVRIHKVGGHVPGHVMVSVDTADGVAMLTGDIVLNYRHIENDWPMGTFWNGDEVLRAYELIHRTSDIVVPSHDFELWERHKDGIIG